MIVDEMGSECTPDSERRELARRLCDRHFGVGADGMIFIESAEGADGSMRLFEPAGNEADMCGNGLRCVAAFIADKLSKDEVSILTRDGVKSVRKDGDRLTVDMGLVRTLRRHLSDFVTDTGKPDDSMLEFAVHFCGSPHQASFLNTGEPHIIVFTEDLPAVDVVGAGSDLNSDKSRFPVGVNINFVQVSGPDAISIRTYERGVYDETLACGTGATASAAAAHLKSLVSGRKVLVSTRGGVLTISLTEDDHAFMTGPANRVYSGTIEADA